VTLQEAKAAAANLGVRVFEVSAKTNLGINEAYNHLVENVMKRKGIKPGLSLLFIIFEHLSASNMYMLYCRNSEVYF